MPSIFDDPEAYAFSDDKEEDLRRKLTNQQAFNAMLQGVGDLPYSLLGAPVELGTGLLRSMGMAQGEQVGGIDYIKRKATELGIRPPDSTDPTMRDMRMGAEIVSGAIDPTRVARVGGVAATAAARKAAPMVGNAIENYMVKSGLAPRIVPEGGLLGSRAFDTTKVDASDIFGVGAQKTMYKDPESGGYIQVLTRPDQPASVTNLEVPEAFRNQGVGGRLQAQASKDFPNMQGQVSSKAAAKSAYKLGRRPVGQPDATLDDVLKIIDKDSSVNLVSPARQQEISGSQGGLTRSLQQGFEHDWYHGTTGDIKSFDKGLLGEATGAPSASEGFFFARDPVSPPASMVQKTSDPKSIELLKKLGKSDKEIADINSVSMVGNGAETASGYAQLRGGRDYKAAMRRANAAEKRQDFDEYDKQMQIAENIETKYDNDLQTLIAKYGDARDVMTEKVNNTFYSLENTQAKAELLDKKYKELMPYGWFDAYDQNQFNNLKKELVELVGKDKAKTALSAIDEFSSVKNERNLLDKTTQGGNVMPVALRYKNPMYHDFGGKAYREQTYKELLQEAKSKGHDALILKNTFDPAAGKAKLVDVGVVFEPNQVRSKFAAFDPLRKNDADLLAGIGAGGLLAVDDETKQKVQSLLGYPQ